MVTAGDLNPGEFDTIAGNDIQTSKFREIVRPNQKLINGSIYITIKWDVSKVCQY
jgi:hypothetical protein